MPSFPFTQNIMYYSYVEIEYVATGFSPARTDLAIKLLTLFYSTSLSQPLQTDRMADRGMNTLAARGLEELFFQLCCCVSFWFWQEVGFGFTYLCTQSTIHLWCCNSFLVPAGNSFWCYIHTQCTIQLCSCVSFLAVAGKCY